MEWVAWANDHDRWLRAAVLEWVLMDPTQGAEFLQHVENDLEFCNVFLGHYTTVKAVLSRLGVKEIRQPMFFLERIQKVKEAAGDCQEGSCRARGMLNVSPGQAARGSLRFRSGTTPGSPLCLPSNLHIGLEGHPEQEGPADPPGDRR